MGKSVAISEELKYPQNIRKQYWLKSEKTPVVPPDLPQIQLVGYSSSVGGLGSEKLGSNPNLVLPIV